MLKRKISSKTSKKLVGLFLLVILALVGLALRITQINAMSGQQYARIVMSQAQQSYEIRTISARRGDITDRNGTILATSEKVYNVILDCQVVNTELEGSNGQMTHPYVEPTIKALSDVLSIDEEQVRDLLTAEETKNSQYQILVKGISITQKKQFEAYCDPLSEEEDSTDTEDASGDGTVTSASGEEVTSGGEETSADSTEDPAEELSDEEIEERYNVKGVWFEEDYVRRYPLNSIACDTIGFTYDGETADWGIEGYYSDVLNGTNGRQYGYFNTDADAEQTIIPAVDGKNVVSTIDANIQQIIRDALQNFENEMAKNEQKTDGALNIGVVVMDPDTGEVLGMDSDKWYDLNNPRDLTPFYTQAEIAAMDDQAQLDALNSIWTNYCVSTAYELGSVFKPITTAAAIQTGTINDQSTFYCDGGQQVEDKFIQCDIYPGEHGTQTIDEALMNSCNDAYMQIAEAIGVDGFLNYQDLFNYGSKTGIDLPGESTGIVFNNNSMGPVDLATSSFGQGFTATMIQETAAICAAINGGYYYKPHVVKRITDANGSVVQEFEPTMERRVISSETSAKVREAMAAVLTRNGTGFVAKIPGYTMGGKTGTAEKLPRDQGNYILSYVGFAPLNDPKAVVYVTVDEPNTTNQDTSVYAESIARNIFTELLPYMNIFPDEEGYDTSSVNTAMITNNDLLRKHYTVADNGVTVEATGQATWSASAAAQKAEEEAAAAQAAAEAEAQASADESASQEAADDTGEETYADDGTNDVTRGVAADGSELPMAEDDSGGETDDGSGDSFFSDGISNEDQEWAWGGE